MDKIINGKVLANLFKQEIISQVKNIKTKLTLAVIQVGDDPASNVYIKGKERLCNEVGINFIHYKFESSTTDEIINKINELNTNQDINSILVQLPLPDELDKKAIIESINPIKDVDGLTSLNIGRLYNGLPCIIPCTAYGILKLLEHIEIDLTGKNVVIIGRTTLVGIPLSAILMNKNATVTICHSKTVNLSEKTKQADILIVAAGNRHLITKEMIKDKAIIIDVGITRDNDKLYGDVNFDDCIDKCMMITPVPGGVGPMTIIMLMNNVIECYKMQNKNEE